MADASLDRRLAYALLRFILGINILLHGLVRLPDLAGFAEGMVSNFEDTILPGPFVRVFAYALVFAEAVVGALIMVGWLTRWALVAGLLLMAALVFGTALQQNWGTLGTQMLYVLIYFVLLFLREYDAFGVDTRRPAAV